MAKSASFVDLFLPHAATASPPTIAYRIASRSKNPVKVRRTLSKSMSTPQLTSVPPPYNWPSSCTEVIQRMPYRVLVVDDETGIREAIRMTLEYEGYRVDEARSGNDGLEK